MQHVPPPMPAYAYGQPAFTVQFSDPSSFRRDYAGRLSELTINSRPIIQNLSMMAQNYSRYADIVAECLQAHIRRVPHWMKLPAFYVLDAISKNVYDPYASKFSAFVVSLFLETYGQVDPSTRSKMEEMLVTWRTGAPSGKELFGVAAQVSLERQVWGNDPLSTLENPSRRQGHAAPLTKSQVLAELDVTLALKEQASHVNPYDAASQNQVNVLHQLRRMVEFGVSQEELQQILSQLRAMSRETASAPPPPASIVQSPLMYNESPTVPLHSQYGQPSATQISLSMQSNNTPVNQRASSSTISKAAESNVSGISNLFESLVKAGLVSASSTPVGAGKSTGTPPPAPETLDEAAARAEKGLEDERKEAQRKYACTILGMRIRLTTAEISRQRPQSVSTIYDQLPVKCKQCALRFPEGPNRRAREAIGRGHSRSWFISVEDWISEPLSDIKGKGRETFSNGKNAAHVAANASAQREAVIKASVVVVPPGDEVKSISCPVCKETIKSDFQEEEEEWVWQNAIRVKDKIYHATCHAEMSTSSTLAAKLRADGAAKISSRSGTPESVTQGTPSKKTMLLVSKSPSPERTLVEEIGSVAGNKRKAESDTPEGENARVGNGVGGTPPLKKTVLSAA
ncbi:hypothetical protein EW145_g1475 [Phellinidium pouzarii]|uniref:CID domain-containing protein n=1 Tax=Phellinidium pouzarii TaxID=167371 RepID=A0A4S4LEP0_9AGAM|nr:hypothetical protein EW145_g1475 [Phellinidium pouzarii]